MRNYYYFLGGNDLEMDAIRRLLGHRGVPVDHIHDHRLGWGAKRSDYGEELKALPKTAIPVLIELENDLDLGDSKKVLVADHHGERAGIDRPTSLEQVWRLLEMPPERWGKGVFADFPLIAANDRGYIPAMRRLGASDDEIADIRARDRAAQGITPAQETTAEEAIARRRLELNGRLTIVELPHDKTATVTDRMAQGASYQNLLVISPDEVNFFGDGGLVCRLDKAWPGGWYGGEIPKQGFWGRSMEGLTSQAVEAVLSEALKSRPDSG